MLEGKIGKGPFFRVQSDELTVWKPSAPRILTQLLSEYYLEKPDNFDIYLAFLKNSDVFRSEELKNTERKM